ncbi:MAG TPA: glycosyltransferase family 4 protein [Flavisolibacter sp.]|nr:glycosyltransferase family 4 protein [Flavisolibacter sp.]
MNSEIDRPRILIFIGSLRSGGKERRLIELLTYLKEKTCCEILLVMTKNEIHYQNFYQLNIRYEVISKKWKRNDPTVFYQLYKICKQFKPHIIHTWGRMQSFYTLPAVIGKHIPLVNSQITGAPSQKRNWSVNYLIDRLNFHFSKVVLANSKAGIASFKPPAAKCKVIYNGINLNRFHNLAEAQQTKAKYGITTPYAVIMTASFSPTKDYNLFLKVAQWVTSVRDDIGFIGVGGCEQDESEYKKMVNNSSPRILFPGKIHDVEALVNACTIGVLFSTDGEGISNSILEYMALGKPVIANDAGGNRELIRHQHNGYLISNQNVEQISELIIGLIDDQQKCQSFGAINQKKVQDYFSLEVMGKAFEEIYYKTLQQYVSLTKAIPSGI